MFPSTWVVVSLSCLEVVLLPVGLSEFTELCDARTKEAFSNPARRSECDRNVYPQSRTCPGVHVLARLTRTQKRKIIWMKHESASRHSPLHVRSPASYGSAHAARQQLASGPARRACRASKIARLGRQPPLEATRRLHCGHSLLRKQKLHCHLSPLTSLPTFSGAWFAVRWHPPF